MIVTEDDVIGDLLGDLLGTFAARPQNAGMPANAERPERNGARQEPISGLEDSIAGCFQQFHDLVHPFGQNPYFF
jgi:hypothetical protein